MAREKVEKKVSVVALDPIQHDGVPYAPEAEFECTQEQAEALYAIGAAKPKAAQAADEAGS